MSMSVINGFLKNHQFSMQPSSLSGPLIRKLKACLLSCGFQWFYAYTCAFLNYSTGVSKFVIAPDQVIGKVIAGKKEIAQRSLSDFPLFLLADHCYSGEEGRIRAHALRNLENRRCERRLVLA